jgi:ligand-binding SRPBCC domain-containing protein
MYYLNYKQKLPLSLKESWDFFSSPTNLTILTPDYLGFEIANKQETSKMYGGQIIAYTVRPLWNLPFHWVTEITHVKEPDYFIDEQRFGPYKFWHHEHRFSSIPNGIEMSDTIYYELPFSFLGRAFHSLKIKQDLENIFSYRYTKLEQLFGIYK